MNKIEIRPTKEVGKRWPKLEGNCHVIDLSLGNGTRFDVTLMNDGQRFYVGIVSNGCYIFNFGILHSGSAGYIAGKLNIGEGDANNLLDFLVAQLAPCWSKGEEYGNYTMSYCSNDDYLVNEKEGEDG